MGKNRDFSKFPNAITVLDSGNVGINQTNPTYTLDVTGTGRLTGALTYTKFIMSGGADQSELTNASNNDFKLTNSGNFRIVNNSNTVALLTVTNTGGVGIGTSSPGALLDISGSGADATLRLTAPTGYGGNTRYLYNGVAQWYVGTNAAGGGENSFTIYGYTGNDFKVVTTGTERMKISSTGIVTTPYQPSFYAVSNAGDTAYTANQVIVFNTTRHNTGSHFNTSNGRFTAPVAGKYLFIGNFYSYGGYNTTIILTINGSQYNAPGDVTPYFVNATNANAISAGFSLIWELAAGDYVEPRSRATSQIYRMHSHFSGQLLS
jgi:hypothetical protein